MPFFLLWLIEEGLIKPIQYLTFEHLRKLLMGHTI